jgi:hypothetical protein
LTKPRSINIFLLDGDPNGIRVAQIMMSTIQAIAFRRNKLGEVRKTFPEIERPGVYSMRRLRPIDFRVVFSRSVVGTQVYELAGESRTRSL